MQAKLEKIFVTFYLYSEEHFSEKLYICAAFVFGLTSRRRIEVCDINIVGAMPSILIPTIDLI